jgi:hypothetical protein
VYFVSGVRDFEIRDNRFEPAGEDAITVWHASRGLISGNTGRDNGENTIDVKDSHEIRIVGNRGFGDKEYCIVAHTVDGDTYNITVQDNDCRWSGSGGLLTAGIALLRVRHSTVVHNRVLEACGPAILVRDGMPAAGNTVAYNWLTGRDHGRSVRAIVLQDAGGSRAYANHILRGRGRELF